MTTASLMATQEPGATPQLAWRDPRGGLSEDLTHPENGQAACSQATGHVTTREALSRMSPAIRSSRDRFCRLQIPPPHGPAKMPTCVSGSPGDEASRGTSHPHLHQPHEAAEANRPCQFSERGCPEQDGPGRRHPAARPACAPHTQPPSSAGTRRGGTDRVPHGPPPPPQLQQPAVLHLGNPGGWRAFPGFTQGAPGHRPQGRLQ